jgi:hypothetical protein
MVNNQENVLRMYYAVCALCDTNAEIWQSNEVFSASFLKLKNKIPEIQKLTDVLKMENIAAETFKIFDRLELEELVFYISGKLLSILLDKKDQDLYSEIENDRNSLSKCSESELVSICLKISQHAFKNINELSDIGVTTTNLLDFQQFLTFFSANLSRIKYNYNKHKNSTELLRKYYKYINEVIKNELDKEIEFFKNSDPDFYNQYLTAREVLNIDPEYSREIYENMSYIVN